MIDFLRANQFVSREEYMWVWTIPQITLACIDFTRIEYKKVDSSKDEKIKPNGKINTVPLQARNAEEFMNMFKGK
jgi:hypothetical protein